MVYMLGEKVVINRELHRLHDSKNIPQRLVAQELDNVFTMNEPSGYVESRKT